MLPPLRKLPQMVPGVLVVDIGIAQKLLHRPDADFPPADRQQPKARMRRSKTSPATGCGWCRPIPRAISNASPTAFISI